MKSSLRGWGSRKSRSRCVAGTPPPTVPSIGFDETLEKSASHSRRQQTLQRVSRTAIEAFKACERVSAMWEFSDDALYNGRGNKLYRSFLQAPANLDKPENPSNTLHKPTVHAIQTYHYTALWLCYKIRCYTIRCFTILL